MVARQVGVPFLPSESTRPSVNRLSASQGIAPAANQANVAVAIVAPSGETSWATRTSLGETPRGAAHAP